MRADCIIFADVDNSQVPTLADRRIIVTVGLRFPVYSRSPLRLGELHQRNAYEIVRIPRAGSAWTLGRSRAHIYTS